MGRKHIRFCKCMHAYFPHTKARCGHYHDHEVGLKVLLGGLKFDIL